MNAHTLLAWEYNSVYEGSKVVPKTRMTLNRHCTENKVCVSVCLNVYAVLCVPTVCVC